ncbi:kinase-like protein [Heliocybe sulcata]|uniref:Kinase-like protein n=1 Tax=Heliocybe sulcata TaxID=5364 RepID=A0A5C3MT53_9AGAM|nr:kinase-like protein [Heliocybe sulcata]
MADGDIRSYLGSRILSVQEVKKWLFNIAVGLNYLHDNDIVHADLRAVNVLVSRNSEGNEVPQITDFGLSRFIATTSAAAQIPSKQSKTEITGNTRWLAPEVIILKGHKHTRESDVWSFGWLCWEIATGTHPLPDLIEPAVYTEVAITYTRPRRDIECKNTNGREIADELWILMEACWSRMPEKRLSMKRIGSQLNPKKKKNSLGQTE